MASKEETYDSEIEPLMAQILTICTERKVAMVASFDIGNGMFCTSCLLQDDHDPPMTFLRARDVILGEETTQSGTITFARPAPAGTTEADDASL